MAIKRWLAAAVLTSVVMSGSAWADVWDITGDNDDTPGISSGMSGV
jgi:hypothetical protein